MKKGKTLEQLKKQKEKQRARMKILYIFLALVLVLSGGYLLLTRYFIINEIVVSESIYYTSEDIIGASGLKKGASLFSCDNRKIEQLLYSRCPYISSVEVKKNFPDTIEISVEEQDGVMYLSILREDYALNRDLKVLGRAKGDAGRIQLQTKGVERCIVGELAVFKDPDDMTLACGLYNELSQTGLAEKTTLIDIRDSFNIMFNYDSRFNVYIGDDSLLDFKIKVFEKVIEDFPNDTGRITISENGRTVINLDDF